LKKQGGWRVRTYKKGQLKEGSWKKLNGKQSTGTRYVKEKKDVSIPPKGRGTGT